jgi:hypothetical protein
MAQLIDSDILIKRRLEKEYKKLMKVYFTFPYAVLPNHSIKKIASIPNVKAIMSHSGKDGVIDSITLNSGQEILQQMDNLEFDYDFVGDSILKLTLTNYIWLDIYFPKPLTQDEICEIEELLERDILDNYKLVDDNQDALMEVYNRIHDIQSEYFYKFNEVLGDDTHEPDNL